MLRVLKKLLITLIFILAMINCAYAAEFSDVSSEHKNYDAIMKLSQQKILNGYEDGSFKPDNNLTRAEFCVIIARMKGYVKYSGVFDKELPFTDVDKEYWAEDYIKYVYNLGIINGMGDGTFLPAGSVTYEQAIKMIVCFTGIEVKEDTSPSAKWYTKYLVAAQEHNLCENVLVKVTESAPRCDVVQMFYNVMNSSYEEEIQDDETSDQEDEKNENIEETEEDEDEPIVFEEVKTILVDPGHNYRGFDIGARNEDESIKEEIITWQISDKLVKKLEEYGFEVWTTRKRKTTSIGNTSVIDSLKSRSDMANELDVDLFISIHCNTGGGTGVEAYCFQKESVGWVIAELISESISDSTKLYNRGAKTSNYYVIKNTVMPSVLVETGFIDSEFDSEILTSTKGQNKIAQAIADAVIEYNKVYDDYNKKQITKGKIDEEE